jgi:hypothetical protein
MPSAYDWHEDEPIAFSDAQIRALVCCAAAAVEGFWDCDYGVSKWLLLFPWRMTTVQRRSIGDA